MYIAGLVFTWLVFTLKRVFHNMSCDFISHCMDSHDVMWSLCREKYLFSGSVDHSIKIWDMESCEVVSTIPAHENPVCTLTINGSRLYSGSLKSIKVMGLCTHLPLSLVLSPPPGRVWEGGYLPLTYKLCALTNMTLSCRCGILKQRTWCGKCRHRTTGSGPLSLQKNISIQDLTKQSRYTT